MKWNFVQNDAINPYQAGGSRIPNTAILLRLIILTIKHLYSESHLQCMQWELCVRSEAIIYYKSHQALCLGNNQRKITQPGNDFY